MAQQAMPPTWLDQLIQKVIDKGDPKAIAQVIADSPQVMDAIKRGLANKPKPGVAGPTSKFCSTAPTRKKPIRNWANWKSTA